MREKQLESDHVELITGKALAEPDISPLLSPRPETKSGVIGLAVGGID